MMKSEEKIKKINSRILKRRIKSEFLSTDFESRKKKIIILTRNNIFSYYENQIN